MRPAHPLPGETVTTDIPARLDRLPWSRFHRLVVVALGITWILDGLEVTIAGAIAGALRDSPSLRLSAAEIGLSASAYLAGAVLGAAFFGYLTDRLGRKKLFNITLGVYLVATALTAFSWNFWSYAFFRFLTGAGIGGEGTAINSAIQELIPARSRGWTDLAINGSFWVGAAAAAAGSIILLDPDWFGPDVGWRIAFGAGAVLGLFILYLRQFIPESPRWLVTHGRAAEAEQIIREIEGRVETEHGKLPPVPPGSTITVRFRTRTPFREIFHTIFTAYRQRAVLGFVLLVTQAFFYNAIFFTYALILGTFYGVPNERVGLYIFPFAVGNFLGPLLLGRLFDTVGRRTMISLTYGLSGVLLALTAILFDRGLLDATTQTVCWSVIFFFASAAASAAYLTVSESFPLEVRAIAIALFFMLGTAAGGIAAPWLFGLLIETGERSNIVWGYFLGAVLMIGGAVTEWLIGVDAERKSLETIARPLSSVPPPEPREAAK